MSTPLVEIRNVTKRWDDVTVLSGANATIAPGITGLLGSNGSGKTTLLGMVLGLHAPSEGDISVLGLNPAEAGPEVREMIGYSPEHHDLPPDIAAHDLVRHMARIHGLPHADANTRANDALWAVGLGEERMRPIGTMSTGQRQRVKLAQAFVHDPTLVLLDEPTDGLDPVQRDDMLTLIEKLGGEHGINIVLSSHLLEEVERVCNQVVILKDGGVAASGPIDQISGGGTGVMVDLDDLHANVAQRLIDVGITVEASKGGSRMLVSSASHTEDTLLDLVRDAVATEGASLRRLALRRNSLEDIFLEVGVS